MDNLLLSANDAAKLLGIGKSLFYKLHKSGKIGPLPVKLGGRSLWNPQELDAWVQARCPIREKWQNREIDQ